MAYNNYGYGGYPTPNYYAPPMPDQLAQLRNGQQYNNPIMNQQPMQQQVPVQQPQQPVMQPTQQQPNLTGPVYVNGEAGMRGYLVAPSCSVLIFDADTDAHTFWIKTADAFGTPSFKTYDYVERTNAPKAQQMPIESAPSVNMDYVTREEWEALQARADALAAELEALKAKKAPAPRKNVKEGDE